MAALIGITTRSDINTDNQPINSLNRAYVDAVVEAGGIPVLIPSLLAQDTWESLYTHLDGILFSGGGDIDANRFAGEPHPRVDGVDETRDALEFGLLRLAASEGKPLLGICRGCQIMNVALGGTLYTHIPDQVPGALDHDYPGNMRTVLVHAVRMEEGTRVGEVLGEPRMMVNSLHHQALKDIGNGVRVAGWAPDGIVEAIELPDHPFAVAVQWHPEWLTDQPGMRSLFRRFVESAAKH